MNNTAPIFTEKSKKTAENRTSPVYMQEKNALSLNDIISPKPADFNGQIDISWLHNALNKKACEIKYAPWDAIYMSKGLWVSSAYGNGTIIVISADGKICSSDDFGANWRQLEISNNLTAITYGNGAFIVVSSAGECYKSIDNGLNWKESNISDDNFSCITYNNSKFIASSFSGNIYISEDYGNSWHKVYENEEIQITKIIYTSSGIIMALAISDKPLSIYSTDCGLSWNKIAMPVSSWSSITYADGKFTACANDGYTRLTYCLEKDIIKNKPSWKNIKLSYNEEWVDISCGNNTYTLVSSNGVILASYDGIRWIKTPCPKGTWSNILRTDYFFMVFSNGEEEHGLNAVRSSNGGLAGIMFADLNEIINEECVDKSINPKTLKDYLDYKTGKNKSQYPTYLDDLLIECTSFDTRQIKITNINAENIIEDYNSITTGGIYIIEKHLINSPDFNGNFLLVQKSNNKIYQFLSSDMLFISGFIRYYENNAWSGWREKLINQKNIAGIDLSDNSISLSVTATYSSIDNILAEENGRIRKFGKTELDEYIDNNITNAIHLVAGNNVYWQNTANYKAGAMVLGSDNALYYCVKENGKENIQNPVSSTIYWQKIIDNDGKINADNLSKILGSFAFLNNIDFTDTALTGILPVAKGGTGADNITKAQKNLHISDYTRNNYPTLDLNDLTDGTIICRITNLTNHPFPLIASGEVIIKTILAPTSSKFADTDAYSYNIQYYISRSNNSIAFRRCTPNSNVGKWTLYRNSDGSIPISFGGTGLNHGALGKPDTAQKLEPDQTNGSNYKSGDVIYRYSLGSSSNIQYVPDGGSWLLKTFTFMHGTGICAVSEGGASIVPGGFMLDTNQDFDFIYILTKIA